MNLEAVVLIGRANIEMSRVSPFSPVGSGICIHPDGVIATCCHTLSNFFQAWSPFEIPRGPDIHLVIEDAERQERPFCFFLAGLDWQNPTGESEASVYPMLSSQADSKQDVAVIELGGGAVDRQLPFVNIARSYPEAGETIQFAGFLRNSETQFDSEGNIVAWRMIHETATVLSCEPEGFLIDYPVSNGMSGSGVCNQQGALLGLIKEVWHPNHAAERVGVDRAVGLVGYARWLIPQYLKLRSEAAYRVAAGDLPWCGEKFGA